MEEKSIFETQKEEVVAQDPNSNIDWVDLVFNIDLISLRILEKFYRNSNPDNLETYVFEYLFRELQGLRVSRRTILRRCYSLQEKGLLRIVEETKPLVIWPVFGIEKNVRKLITKAYSRILGEKR